MNTAKTVFVGLSGGVDSSVAALRLKQQGYRVVGVFIKVWQPDWLNCNWEQERLDAMRVAAHLEIPFLTCDAEAAYKQEVGDFFVSEYLAGRTPNPDVMCNQHVKFGAFLDFAKKHGADYIATGHYAQLKTQSKESSSDLVHTDRSNQVSRSELVHTDRSNQVPRSELGLWRGCDPNKDQSYFLWTLTQAQLASVLLPVGDTPKDQIRAEAQASGIPTAAKKDSQGICFLGHVDIKEFLSHFTDLKPGAVLDEQGVVVGEHQGALIYTVGQRHGFTLSNQETAREAYYVIAKDLTANTITVSNQKPVTPPQHTVSLVHCNWISPLAVGDEVQAQFRYRQQPFAVKVTEINESTATITLTESTDSVAIGQSCVLYTGAECLGGGIIAK